MPLIRDTDGKLTPAVTVCRHIAEKTARTYVRILPGCIVGSTPTKGEEMDDYLCLECRDKDPSEMLPGDIVVLTMRDAQDCLNGMTEDVR